VRARFSTGENSPPSAKAEARDDTGALLAKAIGTFKLRAERDKKDG